VSRHDQSTYRCYGRMDRRGRWRTWRFALEAEGVIDAIATDHAPHAVHEKETDFVEAPCGVLGLETAFGVVMDLVRRHELSPLELIRRLSTNPARILGLKIRACDLVLERLSAFQRGDRGGDMKRARRCIQPVGQEQASRMKIKAAQRPAGDVIAIHAHQHAVAVVQPRLQRLLARQRIGPGLSREDLRGVLQIGKTILGRVERIAHFFQRA